LCYTNNYIPKDLERLKYKRKDYNTVVLNLSPYIANYYIANVVYKRVATLSK
jgi:hypothetical protein